MTKTKPAYYLVIVLVVAGICGVGVLYSAVLASRLIAGALVIYAALRVGAPAGWVPAVRSKAEDVAVCLFLATGIGLLAPWAAVNFVVV
ncbi:MAG: DUF3017 domain-containing protein [Actinomycetaceae bacterium]|nr:DUF3017 domain-containing protein [Actinomycetaceae bacterium]MDY6082907.1 DUF3017 domain-containing protein [Actinomycetaceae bacterium]